MFFFDDPDILKADAATGGATTVGADVAEITEGIGGKGQKPVEDFLCGHGGGQRHVGAGNSLRQGHDVRRDIIMLVAEHFAGPAESGDDLVDDEQNFVFFANFLDDWEVFRNRRDNAAAGGDRFEDYCCHGVRIFLHDGAFQRPGAVDFAMGIFFAERTAITTGVGNFNKSIREGSVAILAFLLPAGRQHGQGTAMIVPVAVDDFMFALFVFGYPKV